MAENPLGGEPAWRSITNQLTTHIINRRIAQPAITTRITSGTCLHLMFHVNETLKGTVCKKKEQFGQQV